MLTTAGLLILLLLFSGSFAGFGAGIIFLGLALALLLQGALGESNLQIWILSYALALAFPLTAFLAGAFLDQFCFTNRTRVGFRFFLLALSLSLCFQPAALLGFIDSLLAVLASGSALKLSAFLTSLASALLFCAGLMAFCVMLLVLSFELSARWLIGAAGARTEISFVALRSLLTLIVLALAFNGGVGLMLNELRPAAIIQRAVSG